MFYIYGLIHRAHLLFEVNIKRFSPNVLKIHASVISQVLHSREIADIFNT